MPSLDWIGKDKILNHDRELPFRVLKTNSRLSTDKASPNLLIEGDNLEALKALMPFYYGRFDCVYIDPPYNTGNEGWVYYDRVNAPKIKSWLNKVVGAEGEDLCRHDKWLCMMYPRLKMIRELMSATGVIFVSIDDNEVGSLRTIMDSIFGRSNHLGTVTWFKKRKGSYLSKGVVSLTEYILVYRKGGKPVQLFGGSPDSEESQPLVKRTNSVNELKFPANFVETKLKDGHYKRGTYGSGSSAVELLDKAEVKNGRFANEFRLRGPFTWNQPMLSSEIGAGSKIVINTMNLQPRVFRVFDQDRQKGFPSFLDGRTFSATTDDAYEELKKIFGQDRIFEYSKPTQLIKKLVEAATYKKKDALVLDSFAGSGTTGQAVLELNKEDKKSNRSFVLVELEPNIVRKVTVPRLKAVIKGYAGARHPTGTGGGIQCLDLNGELFGPDGFMNPSAAYEDIASYLVYAEKAAHLDIKSITKPYLGEFSDVHIFLFYKEKGRSALDQKSLKRVEKKTGQKIVFADQSLLDNDELAKRNIVFKQIPYEIRRF